MKKTYADKKEKTRLRRADAAYADMVRGEVEQEKFESLVASNDKRKREYNQLGGRVNRSDKTSGVISTYNTVQSLKDMGVIARDNVTGKFFIPVYIRSEENADVPHGELDTPSLTTMTMAQVRSIESFDCTESRVSNPAGKKTSKTVHTELYTGRVNRQPRIGHGKSYVQGSMKRKRFIPLNMK